MENHQLKKVIHIELCQKKSVFRLDEKRPNSQLILIFSTKNFIQQFVCVDN